MRVAIRRTGLSADALRAWERRYGAVEPDRTAGGQRLYSDEDLERLTLLHRLTEAGRPISQVAGLDADSLRGLLAEDELSHPEPVSTARAGEADHLGSLAMRAVEQLDGDELDRVLRRGVMNLGAAQVIERVIAPFLRDLGDRWHRGEITPAHEHLGSAVVRQVLTWLQGSSEPLRSAPGVVIATPAGQRHELGALIAAAVAAGEGWRVIYLGTDLPSDAIAEATRQARARMVGISVVSNEDPTTTRKELRNLREALPADVTLIAGGAGAGALQGDLAEVGVRTIPDLAELRVLLRTYLNPTDAALGTSRT